MIFRHVIFLVSTAALAACSAAPNIQKSQHWQRASTSEAVYQQGPKAEQILKRDIGRCVVELQEMEDLGAVEDPIKTDASGRVLGPDQVKEKDWNGKQELNKRKYDEDFLSCMETKGWERVYAPGTNYFPTTSHYGSANE